MTEKTMERRRRYRQRHRRNTLATWVAGAACAAMLVFLAAMGCRDYVNKLPPPESSTFPGLALSETKQGTPDPTIQDSQPQEPSGTVYEDGTDWNLRLVNRWNPIPEGYNVNLKELPGGEKVDERIYGPLTEMLEAAREGNWDELPRVISGYRTQEVQQELYDAEVNKYKSRGYSEEEAKAEAGKWVAVPGTSEHQLGLTVDFVTGSYRTLDEGIKNTEEYQWVEEHAWEYGYVIRYPSGKSGSTGIISEPWHLRYVGIPAAKLMTEQGICLEEFLGVAYDGQRDGISYGAGWVNTGR